MWTQKRNLKFSRWQKREEIFSCVLAYCRASTFYGRKEHAVGRWVWRNVYVLLPLGRRNATFYTNLRVTFIFLTFQKQTFAVCVLSVEEAVQPQNLLSFCPIHLRAR